MDSWQQVGVIKSIIERGNSPDYQLRAQRLIKGKGCGVPGDQPKKVGLESRPFS